MRSLGAISVLGVTVCCCSIIADPDEFTYIEGSASDNGGDTDTDADTDADTDTDTDADTDVDTDTDTDGPLGAVCSSNDDCDPPAYCPQFFETSTQEELTSRCYVDCEDDRNICDDSPSPYCYRHERGAVCLKLASIQGDFVCRRSDIADTSAVSLYLATSDAPIVLRECALIAELGTLGFVFSAQAGDDLFEAIFYVPGIEVGDLEIGNLENGSGMAYRQRGDFSGGEFVPAARFIHAVFPPPEPPQYTSLRHRIDIDDVTLGGAIRGTIDFEGFVYDAEISLNQ